MQNILRKIRKSSRARQSRKTLIPAFAYLISAGVTEHQTVVTPEAISI